MLSFLIVIEHLEPCLNKWLLTEYEFVTKIYGSRVIFTNVKNEEHHRILSRYAKVYSISATDMLKDLDSVIVLDPEANKELEPEELMNTKYVILGGIMGDHPPRRRTKLYITSKLPRSRARNLGKLQYTIFGAAYVLKQIELGKKVHDIKFIYGLDIKKILGNNVEVNIHLPYAFPLDDNGNIVLPNNYL
ncbi:MAG: SAM-dependent methyltransferase, partial [Ignisphaera sp.]